MAKQPLSGAVEHRGDTDRPGSDGERALQRRFGTVARADAFYTHQVLDYLNPLMQEFIAAQEMVFVSTASASGACDTSFRAGPPGFVQVLDANTLLYPELRGNGVMASLGNIVENPHLGLLFIDFFKSTVGLHINGTAHLVENKTLALREDLPEAIRHSLSLEGRQRPERWVMVTVEEAYIHCSKHIPLLQKLDKTVQWGTDDVARKGGDYFRAKTSIRRTTAPRSGDGADLPDETAAA
jgi:uncharacterized protein